MEEDVFIQQQELEIRTIREKERQNGLIRMRKQSIMHLEKHKRNLAEI